MTKSPRMSLKPSQETMPSWWEKMQIQTASVIEWLWRQTTRAGCPYHWFWKECSKMCFHRFRPITSRYSTRLLQWWAMKACLARVRMCRLSVSHCMWHLIHRVCLTWAGKAYRSRKKSASLSRRLLKVSAVTLHTKSKDLIWGQTIYDW